MMKFQKILSLRSNLINIVYVDKMKRQKALTNKKFFDKKLQTLFYMWSVLSLLLLSHAVGSSKSPHWMCSQFACSTEARVYKSNSFDLVRNRVGNCLMTVRKTTAGELQCAGLCALLSCSTFISDQGECQFSSALR